MALKNLKNYIQHLEGDIKGFKEEAADDKKLIKKIKNKKAGTKKVKKHLKDDMKYYDKEKSEDKMFLKKMESKNGKKKSKKPSMDKKRR